MFDLHSKQHSQYHVFGSNCLQINFADKLNFVHQTTGVAVDAPIAFWWHLIGKMFISELLLRHFIKKQTNFGLNAILNDSSQIVT